MRRRDLIRQGLCAAAGLSLVHLRGLETVVSARQSPPAFDEIDRLVRRLMVDAAVPGVSIAVIDAGRVAWRGAFGVCDARSRVPVRDDSLFAVASVNKTVFAYAAMNLCDKGVIGLDTPLVHEGPEWPKSSWRRPDQPSRRGQRRRRSNEAAPPRAGVRVTTADTSTRPAAGP